MKTTIRIFLLGAIGAFLMATLFTGFVLDIVLVGLAIFTILLLAKI